MEVFETAVDLSRSADPWRRARAADILSQASVRERTFPDTSFDILLGLLTDASPEVVRSAISGLQSTDRDRAAPHILPFAADADPRIREAVTFALGGVDTPEAITALLTLTEDTDAEVRNWATFGIGTLSDRDSDAIRAALSARLDDKDHIVRTEAINGLSRRGDERALGPCIALLRADLGDCLAWDAVKMLGIELGEHPTEAGLLRALEIRHQQIVGASGLCTR